MRTVVVIPAHNEERTVGGVVRRVREIVPHVFHSGETSRLPLGPLPSETRARIGSGPTRPAADACADIRPHPAPVIVIDDGSSDATGERARTAGAMVVRHAVNRGLGAALGTGFAAALRSDAECIVTLDADGQHDPADIPALIAPIERGDADVVIGTRFGGYVSPPPTPPLEEGERNDPPLHLEGGRGGVHGAPRSRLLANRTANLVTRALFGVQCSDTQSGFRALSRRAAEQLDLRTNRMEVSSEIIAEAARLRLRIAEVPIRTIYTAYSLSKGQSPIVGLRTAWGLVMRRWY